ncbi:MAG: hypothetical protein AAB472_03430 [Patescibacteria group bacterium]
MKNLIAVKYDCKEYANRLWNDLSVYAASLELGAKATLPPLVQNIPFLRTLYEVYAQYIGRVLHPKDSMFAWGGTVRYLPPTTPLPEKYTDSGNLYLLGMLFRNPLGFEKYGTEIKERFRAPDRVTKRIGEILQPLAGRTLIGIHVRQRPFTYFSDGEFLLQPERVEAIVSEYLAHQGLSKGEVGLVVVSDGPFPNGAFAEYATVRGTDVPSLDFHLLSTTSVIIGTNSSMSNLAAWFGNTPHVVTLDEPIDWEYYKGRGTFFENKYATFTQKVSPY